MEVPCVASVATKGRNREVATLRQRKRRRASVSDIEENVTVEDEEYTYISYLISLPPRDPCCVQTEMILEKYVADQRAQILSQGRLTLDTTMPTPVMRYSQGWRRQVIFVGVEGPSGSGKTSLATWLASALESPYGVISTDCFVRAANDIPTCPHVAPEGCRQWDATKCYELPGAYDLNLLVDELRNMRTLIGVSTRLPTIWLKLRPGSYRERKPRKHVPLAQTVYIVVEGFVLFMEPQVVETCTYLLQFDVPPEVSCQRRFRRERKLEHQRQGFEEHYFHHVHAARQSLLPLVDRSVAGRCVWRIDAVADQSSVKKAVLKVLLDAESQKPRWIRGTI